MEIRHINGLGRQLSDALKEYKKTLDSINTAICRYKNLLVNKVNLVEYGFSKEGSRNDPLLVEFPELSTLVLLEHEAEIRKNLVSLENCLALINKAEKVLNSVAAKLKKALQDFKPTAFVDDCTLNVLSLESQFGLYMAVCAIWLQLLSCHRAKLQEVVAKAKEDNVAPGYLEKVTNVFQPDSSQSTSDFETIVNNFD